MRYNTCSKILVDSDYTIERYCRLYNIWPIIVSLATQVQQRLRGVSLDKDKGSQSPTMEEVDVRMMKTSPVATESSNGSRFCAQSQLPEPVWATTAENSLNRSASHSPKCPQTVSPACLQIPNSSNYATEKRATWSSQWYLDKHNCVLVNFYSWFMTVLTQVNNE